MVTGAVIQSAPSDPPIDCQNCRRLVDYRAENAAAEPNWFNGAVPSRGDPEARLLIIGLAPGRQGANRTGRPFTGDASGALLYATLRKHGWTAPADAAVADQDCRLNGVTITNAVRCAPPNNNPTAAEIAACRPHLAAQIANLPKLRAILTLGRIAHESTLRALGERLRDHPFTHGAQSMAAGPNGPLTIAPSYHCSRYNTNPGRLTPQMFDAVFAGLATALDRSGDARAGGPSGRDPQGPGARYRSALSDAALRPVPTGAAR
ncbi:MAG: uracil-DNA glycosylase [Pseudomonadota bacterium]